MEVAGSARQTRNASSGAVIHDVFPPIICTSHIDDHRLPVAQPYHIVSQVTPSASRWHIEAGPRDLVTTEFVPIMAPPNAISREQAYLAAIASQPKDATPERLYEVGE